MSDGWPREEIEALVAAYFAMIRAELTGASCREAEHRRKPLPLLQGRSEQPVKFKHANISTILVELGFPFISGYKLRSNPGITSRRCFGLHGSKSWWSRGVAPQEELKL